MSALILCDLQPDFLGKFTDHEALLDRTRVALHAARTAGYRIIFTGVRFSSNYAEVDQDHKIFGAFKRLHQMNPSISWFTGEGSNIDQSLNVDESETTLFRHQLLPRAQDLLAALQGITTAVVVGIKASTTVNAICQVLGDVSIAVGVIDECIADDSEARCAAMLEHVLPIFALRLNLADFLESTDTLSNDDFPSTTIKYYTDCGRGGHLVLYRSHLRRLGYRPWPTQPWYQEPLTGKAYQCPVGRRVVDVADEPRFSSLSLFVSGREWLDEKDKFATLVPEWIPPTFATIEEALTYRADDVPLWFVKAVDQNGGRAVQAVADLAECRLTEKQLIQAHIPRPLLFEGKKCHVKTYQLLMSDEQGQWQLYQYATSFLSLADKPWTPDDLSDAVQITTLRSRALTESDEWLAQHQFIPRSRARLEELVRRAVAQERLRWRDRAQFEIFSADWMLDAEDRLYWIECNFTPVLFDPQGDQPLTTKGLQRYARLYREDPSSAVVDDHAMIRDALLLGLGFEAPEDCRWRPLCSFS